MLFRSSIQLLTSFLPAFVKRCVEGIVVDEQRCAWYVDKNPALATFLSPKIGYLEASKIAKQALAEDAGTEFDEIVGQADEMARKAKSDGGDRSAVADVSASRRWRMRNVIARGMVSALQAQDDAIVPYFQPIVSLPDVRVQGFEMLLRLGEPSLADIPISECIAVAEHTGQIGRAHV